MNKISVFLDVALSLTFFYLIASMFVSGITEFINTLFEKRSNLLWESLGKLQNSWAIGQKGAFNEHPLVCFFEHQKGMIWSKAVSYIHSSTFVSVVLDKMKNSSGIIPNTLEEVRNTLANLEEGDFKDVVNIFLQESTDIKEFKAKLSEWFDQYMVQVSGWYKRYTRIVLWVVATIISIALNLNSITITQRLYTDPDLRDSMVKKALNVAENKNFARFEQNTKNGFLKYLQTEDSSMVDSVDRIVIKKTKDSSDIALLYHQYINKDSTSKPNYYLPAFIDTLKKKDPSYLQRTLVVKANTGLDSLVIQEKYAQYLQQNLTSLGLPLGWAKEDCNSVNVWSFIGWFLTAAALSFGAPFWFDLLLKIVNVRNVVGKEETSKS